MRYVHYSLVVPDILRVLLSREGLTRRERGCNAGKNKKSMIQCKPSLMRSLTIFTRGRAVCVVFGMPCTYWITLGRKHETEALLGGQRS